MDNWIKIEESILPVFTMLNITNYFITRIADDGLPTNAFKNINRHAYPLFKARHIQSILVSNDTESDKYKVQCSCVPEMWTDLLYKVNVTLDANADLTSASCDCPAGGGPIGCCKHIAALCFALEEYSRIKQVRSPRSCTSVLQTWNQPRKRKLDSREVDDIPFIKHEYGKTKRQPDPLL